MLCLFLFKILSFYSAFIYDLRSEIPVGSLMKRKNKKVMIIQHISENIDIRRIFIFQKYMFKSISSEVIMEEDGKDEIVCRIIIEDIVKRHLKGFVEIITPGEVIIKYALIEISGIATCEFPLEKSIFKFPRYYRKGTTVTGEELFYYTRHTLCGGNLAHKHKGVEGYEFFCGWPTRLPTTWTGEFGFIRYWGKVTIIGSSGVFTHRQEILVSNRRDLSLEEHLTFESLIKVHRPFHFMKHLGYIDIDIWIPFSGVAVKQSIPVLCSVDNQSSVLFGSIIFVLTRIDIYRSSLPVAKTKTVRTDVCRVPKMVNITKGKSDYYCVLETDEHTICTSQFHNCSCCQIIYEVWVSVQGAFSRFGPYGYPNIDTPGIPIIVGTEPIYRYNISKITANVMHTLLAPQHDIEMADNMPLDKEVQELLNVVDEELDAETIKNLNRQFERNTEGNNFRLSQIAETHASGKPELESN